MGGSPEQEFAGGLLEGCSPVFWGFNGTGQLGNLTFASTSSPVSIVGGHLFWKISCGEAHVIGLKEDGTAWTWGKGGTGQLGDGTTISKSSPVQVIGGHLFANVGAGEYHSGGIKANGELWMWGENGFGQLGDGTTTNQSSPVQVIGGHLFTQISRGYRAAAGRKSDGTVWTWGQGTHGALGTGNETDRASPVEVIGGHNFMYVACGAVFLAGSYNTTFMVGLKDNGQAWTWGGNYFGNLGIGTNGDGTHQSSPVQVIGGHLFIGISVAGNSASGLKSTGSIWGWGKNSRGELGDNSLTLRNSPVAVVGSI
jgi:alpha-tubulin suppressor-like RCC1 family protein